MAATNSLSRQLWNAAENGRPLAELEKLIAEGADPNETFTFGTCALHWAAYNGNLEHALLLARNMTAPGAAFDQDHKTGLHYAAKGNHTALLDELLRIFPPEARNIKDEAGKTYKDYAMDHLHSELRAAAKAGKPISTLSQLIAADADVNKTDSRGRSALYEAANACHVQQSIFLAKNMAPELVDGYKLLTSLIVPPASTKESKKQQLHHSNGKKYAPLAAALLRANTRFRPAISKNDYNSLFRDRVLVDTMYPEGVLRMFDPVDAQLRYNLTELYQHPFGMHAVPEVANATINATTSTVESVQTYIYASLQDRLRFLGSRMQDSRSSLSKRVAPVVDYLNNHVWPVLENCNLPVTDSRCRVLQDTLIEPSVLLIGDAMHNLLTEMETTPKTYQLLCDSLSGNDRKIYDAQHSKTIQNNHDTDFKNLNSMIEELERKAGESLQNECKQQQPYGNVVTLTFAAREQLSWFEKIIRSACGGRGIEIKFRSGTKSIYRIIEKSLLKHQTPGKPFSCSRVLDVSGCIILCHDYQAMKVVVENLFKFHFDGKLTLVRCKNRFKNPTPGGWRDIALNCQLPNGVIAEIQIAHNDLMKARHDLGGHEAYDTFRCFVELFRVLKVNAFEPQTGLRRDYGTISSMSVRRSYTNSDSNMPIHLSPSSPDFEASAIQPPILEVIVEGSSGRLETVVHESAAVEVDEVLSTPLVSGALNLPHHDKQTGSNIVNISPALESKSCEEDSESRLLKTKISELEERCNQLESSNKSKSSQISALKERCESLQKRNEDLQHRLSSSHPLAHASDPMLETTKKKESSSICLIM